MKKAIVIGGGIGGLSIAARLLKDGFKVELYEKNNSVGGKVNLITHGNFKFDLTASLLMIPNDYINVFKYCGKNYKEYFSLIPINSLYKVFYYDNTNYSFSTHYPSLCKTIDKITNNNLYDKYSYFNFLSLNYKKYLLHEILNIMVRVPNLSYSNMNWTSKSIIKLENKILNIISKISGLEDIKSHILFKHHLTPLNFKNKFNTYAGSAFGISHNLSQSLSFRPQCILPNIKNLYFTGASIHPGNGISMVLKSSKICADIIKEQ